MGEDIACYNVFLYAKVLYSKGGIRMANKIRTSKSIATKASSQLRSDATTKNTKSVAASALANRRK